VQSIQLVVSELRAFGPPQELVREEPKMSAEIKNRLRTTPLDNYRGHDCTSRMKGSIVSIGSAVSTAVAEAV
jgi:hypothetical protein